MLAVRLWESYNQAMPTRRNAKGPGEFIRDHLSDSAGRDYVGSMYQAYKDRRRASRRCGCLRFWCRRGWSPIQRALPLRPGT